VDRTDEISRLQTARTHSKGVSGHQFQLSVVKQQVAHAKNTMAAALTMTQTAQTMAHTALKTINNAQQRLHSITA